MVVKGYTRLRETHKALSPRKGVEKVLGAYNIARLKGEQLPPLVILGVVVTDRITRDDVSGFTDSGSRNYARPDRPRGYARPVRACSGTSVPVGI